MQILATNLSQVALAPVTLSYLDLTGAPVSDTSSLPERTVGSPSASLISGTKEGSSFTSVTLSIGGLPHTVAFGTSLPAGLGIQVVWAQDPDASIVVVIEEGVGGM